MDEEEAEGRRWAAKQARLRNAATPGAKWAAARAATGGGQRSNPPTAFYKTKGGGDKTTSDAEAAEAAAEQRAAKFAERGVSRQKRAMWRMQLQAALKQAEADSKDETSLMNKPFSMREMDAQLNGGLGALDAGDSIPTVRESVHVGLKFHVDGTWRAHFKYRKGRYYETENRAGIVPRQRAERMALNAGTADDAAAVLIFDGMLTPNVHYGAAATAGCPETHLAGLRGVHRDAMRARAGGRTAGYCEALLEAVTGRRSVADVRRRKLVSYVARGLALPDGHLAKEVLRAAREGTAMSDEWRGAVAEACRAAGTEGSWTTFAKPGAAVRKAIRANLDQVEKANRRAAIRAGTGIQFQRHVAAVLERRGRPLALGDQITEAHSTTGIVFLRQARADMVRGNRNTFVGNGRVNGGDCAVAGCGGREDAHHIVALCKGWGLPDARKRWATAVGRTDGPLTYNDAVRLVAMDETMAPAVTAETFRRETLRLMRDVAKARFKGRLV